MHLDLNSSASPDPVRRPGAGRPLAHFDRLARLARLVAPAAVLAICVLSLVPGSERPHTGLAGQVEHMLAYALTAAALTLGRPARAAWIVPGLALLSGAMEVAQIWIPGRTAQVVDAVASSGGALLGAGLVLAVLRLADRLTDRLVGSRPPHA